MKTLRYDGAGSPRLDAFIAASLPGLPAGRLHKYLRENRIKLNGKKQPPATRLKTGDEVRLYLPGGWDAPPPLCVVYEDEHLLAADKPPGLPSEAPGGADSLLARAHTYVEAAGGDTGGAALCHRLDTGTGGLILVAKTAPALALVEDLLRRHRIAKTYLAVTVAPPAPPAGTMTGWLQKDAQRGMVQVLGAPAPGAKEAETGYETLAVSGRLALVRLLPKTGRTHQLRAQLAHLGAPILGDSKYGIQKHNRALRCRYQCLCAAALAFPGSLEPPFTALSGLQLRCAEPWYVAQVRAGALFLDD